MELKNQWIWRPVRGAQAGQGPSREIMRVAGLCGVGRGPETALDIACEVRS